MTTVACNVCQLICLHCFIYNYIVGFFLAFIRQETGMHGSRKRAPGLNVDAFNHQAIGSPTNLLSNALHDEVRKKSEQKKGKQQGLSVQHATNTNQYGFFFPCKLIGKTKNAQSVFLQLSISNKTLEGQLHLLVNRLILQLDYN